ncbi:MAG: hypothetical protein ACP5R5_09110 [Armatimonadota bacterium]
MSRSILRGIVLIVIAAAVVLALVLLPPRPAKKQHPPNDHPWMLVNYNPGDPYGTYLGNGFISTRIMGDGVGSQNGKPLACYMAGLYDDEKLVPLPTWSDLRFYDGRTRFVIDRSAYYKQTLDMRIGILTTHATWRAGSKTLKGKIHVIVSRAQPNLAVVRAELMPDFTGQVAVRAPLGTPEPALQPAGGSIARIIGGRERVLRAYKCSQSGIVVALAATHDQRLRARRGNRAVVHSWVSVASGRDAEAATRDAVSNLDAAVADTDVVIARHKAAWRDLWRSDIAVDGPRKDQQVIHSCMFYLLSSVREGSKWSIPPMGLSNDAFSGHVFWDADIWMFPALILQHPELARSIVEYRYQTLPGAMQNAREAGMPGAQYAWESGFSGKEATPEGLVYRHERHINGDVALAQWQYFLATGDLNWLKSRGWPVIKSTADWWVGKAKWIPERSRYEILQVVPPDESADLVNNSAYTNAIAKLNLEIACRAAVLVGQRPDPKWSKVAARMYIPFDPRSRRFVAFDEWGSQRFGPRYTTKQADTELLIYPLQFNFDAKDMTDIYKNTFDYYARRVHKGGPAMTSSVHSVIAARLGDRRRAYSEFVRSYKPFLRGPFNFFNEQPSRFKENMCFLTGCAGPIQAVLFGLAGIKMDYLGSSDLKYKPCLPIRWKSLKITGLKWRGGVFDLVVYPGDRVEVVKK